MRHLPLLAFLISSVGATQAVAAAVNCNLDSIKKIAPPDAMVDSVKMIAGPVAHCEVLGHTITQNPGPNKVEWSVLLPEKFLNRYYVMGQGAAAGSVYTANSLNTLKLLNSGFVFSTSDTGHKGSMWDFGANNPVQRLDYGHRGAHVSLVATKAITKAYYGMKDKLYSYHLGCSGGGRMGMMAAYHHPEDFDGIVASTVGKGGGALYFGYIAQHVLKNPDNWISPEKLAVLEKKVDEKCAGPDGLVRDPYGCGFDVTTVQCKGGDGPDCLTAAQVSTVKVITGRFPTGFKSDTPGFSISNPTGWAGFLLGQTKPTNTDPENPWAPGRPPSSFGIVQSIARGMYFDDVKFNVIRDLDYKNKETLQRMDERHPEWGLTSSDLSGFKKAGGKLIMWAPMSENAVPPATEIESYEDFKKTVPGVDDFIRLYEAPGVHHCGGGIGPQDVPDRLLDKVIAWAEDGKRPDAVIANIPLPRAPGPAAAGAQAAPLPEPPSGRTVLLCPYPQKAVFKGKKGTFPYDADNWKCQ